MVTPIVVLTIPSRTPPKDFAEAFQRLEKKLHDYHVVILAGDVEYPTIKVFHEKDITELEVGELRSMLIESLNK